MRHVKGIIHWNGFSSSLPYLVLTANMGIILTNLSLDFDLPLVIYFLALCFVLIASGILVKTKSLRIGRVGKYEITLLLLNFTVMIAVFGAKIIW